MKPRALCAMFAGGIAGLYAQAGVAENVAIQDLTPKLLGSGRSLQAKVQDAFDLRNDLTDAAIAALYDQNGARKAFEAGFGLPKRLEDIYAEVQLKSQNKLSGDDLHRAVLKEITTLPEKPFAFEATPACFPKGTLVHTQNGLVPIEQIKVGDMVLSKHESGEGEQAYKPVTRVFEHGPTRVIKLSYLEDVEKPGFGGRVFTTLNHPFWVDGKGWTEARLLKFWDGKASIPTYSGQAVRSAGIGRIAATSKTGIGWMALGADVIDDFGFEWDFENNALVNSRVYADEDASFEDNPMQVPVWNLEVEDYHTYYVGEDGLWVHNKNSDNAIKAMNNGNPIDSLPSFFSKTELKRYLQDNNGGMGSGLVLQHPHPPIQFAPE